MQRQVNTQNGIITYTLTFKKVKNINLRISSEGTVSVSAPKRIPVKVIDDFVISKSVWIINCLNKYSKKADKSYEITGGNKIDLLGHTYTVNTINAKNKDVYISDDIIFIRVKDINDQKEIKRVFERFYSSMCERVFKEVIEDICKDFSEYDITPNKICARFMKTRFGSCIPSKRKITLNKHLLKARYELIRYVASHELAHLIVPNHSAEFYSVLSVFEPNYKLLKKELNDLNLF